MNKVVYKGPDDHVVLSLDNVMVKFKIGQEREVSDINLAILLASKSHKFERVEVAEAKVLPARGRNRLAPKVEVKDEPEL